MDPFEDEIKKRQEYARELGWSEDDIMKATLFEQEKRRQGGSVPEVGGDISVGQETQPTEKPSTITGRTLLEHMRALQKAREARDKPAAKAITEDYNREFEYQKQYGYNKKQEDAKKVKSDIANVAREMKGVMANKNQYDPEDYKDTINSLASSLVLKKKEAENLGAALSGNELAILSGQTPVVKQYGTSIGSYVKQVFTGEMPVQRGEVTEDEKTLNNKLTLLIAAMEGEPIDSSMFKQVGQKVPKEIEEGEKINWNIVENAANEVVGFAKATPEIAKAIFDYAPAAMTRAFQGRPTDEDIEVFKQFAGGLLEDLGKTTGFSMDETGHVKWDPKAAAIHDWNHPLGTLAYVASFLKVAKGVTGAKVAKEVTATTGFPKVPPKTPGAIRGRLLTSVAYPVSGSVAKSEALMRDAYQITKPTALTGRGISKELEKFVPKAGANIEKYARDLDRVIGPEPAGDIIGTVMQKVSENSVVQANPEMARVIERVLENKLSIGLLPEGFKRGEPFATNISTINEARKYLNSSISKGWFKNGQPLASSADQLNSLKWDASNALKDIMIEADKTGGYFGKAINLQHSALSVAPVLSGAEAIGTGQAFGISSALFRAGLKATEPFRVTAGRIAAGKKEPLVKAIVEGKVPKVSGPAAEVPATPQGVQFKTATGFPRKPLEPEIINQVGKGKGPAQFKRLVEEELVSATGVPIEKGGRNLIEWENEHLTTPELMKKLEIAKEGHEDTWLIRQIEKDVVERIGRRGQEKALRRAAKKKYR